MAHYAKITEENEVLGVLCLDDVNCQNENNEEIESIGQQYLETNNNWPAHLWIKTSYNTYHNKHKLGGTPFRGNYASTEMIYEPTIDAFIAPRPTDSYGVLCESWTCDAETDYQWEPPIQKPTTFPDGLIGEYIWNEQAHQENNSNGWDFVGTSAPNPES